MRINWHTAEVDLEGREGAERLVLMVSLSVEPDARWTAAFRDLAKEAGGVGHGIDWTVDGPTNGRVFVRGLRNEQVESVRESLDSLVIKANEQAEHAHRAEEQKLSAEHTRLESLRRDAEAMTERFRQPGSS